MCFDYFGVEISIAVETLETNLDSRATRTPETNIICKNQNLTTECKSRIYITCIRPVMAYGTEAIE